MADVNTYLQGSRVKVTNEFTDDAGAAQDPSAVKLRIKPPTGSVIEYVYGVDAALLRDSTGRYHADIDVDTPGRWTFRFIATGTGKSTDQRVFNVTEAAV